MTLSARDNRLSSANAALAERIALERESLPWQLPEFAQCRPRILMVADYALNFSVSRFFGLGVFATHILDMQSPARPIVTLAHMQNGETLLPNDDRVARRINLFRFDDPTHFAPDMFDVVFLFGFEQERPSERASTGPIDSLADSELEAITRFMNAGGGFFATGDHGKLGAYVGKRLPRAGGMRLWEGVTGNPDDDDAMIGATRHDTNVPTNKGGAIYTSDFDDQGDDVPQTIFPRMYSRNNAIFRYSFPHPLLCGPNGRITVMPDHPHEGECVEPSNTDGTIQFDTDLGSEFPPALDGGPRPLPEVISRNYVSSGKRAVGAPTAEDGLKDPTIGHSFGGICAYDGHRAGVGRVVTDSTWHHFLTDNLVGVGTEFDGFLGSPAGQVHYEDIKTYFHNLVTWLCPPHLKLCMRFGWVFELVQNSRAVEAITSGARPKLTDLRPRTLQFVGAHARDTLGKMASQCEARKLQKWIADLMPDVPEWSTVARAYDPWATNAGIGGTG